MYTDRDLKYAKILSEIIKVKTVSDWNQKDISIFGTFQAKLKELFPNVFQKCEVQVIDGSLLIKWQGEKDSKKKPILIMYHQDVVEAPGTWKYPPFSGEIAEGKLWGRGTLDVKVGLFGMLQAADELIAEGHVPKQDIYFESARNEETDGTGASTIAQKLKDEGVFFEMILDEGGMIIREPMPGVDGYFALVGLGEKAYADVRFTAKSNGGHASAPPKDTPLVRLGKFMAEVDSTKTFKVEIAPAIEGMFLSCAPHTKGILKHVFKHPKLFGPLIRKVLPSASATGKALLQTTVAFTEAMAVGFTNVLPHAAFIIANMRFSHHEGMDEGLRKIDEIGKKYELEMHVDDRGVESKLCDPNTETFHKFAEVINETFQDVQVTPYIAISTGDGRFFSDLTDNCFRFLPITYDDEQLGTIHGLNENVNIDNLGKEVDFFRNLMQKEF